MSGSTKESTFNSVFLEKYSNFKGRTWSSLNDPGMKRAGFTVQERIFYVPFLAGTWGLFLGGYQGGKLAGYQYLAERQHRLPRTLNDWYFYHKLKNYKVMLASIKSGSNMGGKLIAIGLGYEFIQWACDLTIFDSKPGWASSTIAGFSTALIFAQKVKLPKRSRNIALVAGTSLGLLSGALQELASRY